MDILFILQSIVLILLVNSDLCINYKDDDEGDLIFLGASPSRHSRHRPSDNDYEYEEYEEQNGGSSRHRRPDGYNRRSGLPRWAQGRRRHVHKRDRDFEDREDYDTDYPQHERGIASFASKELARGPKQRSAPKKPKVNSRSVSTGPKTEGTDDEASSSGQTKKKMLRLKGPEEHATGGNAAKEAELKNPMTEEHMSTSEKVHTRSKKDGLGKSMSAKGCGISHGLAERIVGGKLAKEGAYPWIVAILKDGDPWCGGSILNEHWIVTAAHCFIQDENDKKPSFAIRAGSNNRNTGTTYKIKKVISHERFNADDMLNSDIALMSVTKPIQYSDKVTPICLPDNSLDEPKTSKAIVAGWGAMKFEGQDLPVMLQDVTLNIVPDSDCMKRYLKKNYKMYKSQFCTWALNKDACQGDSGGPAIEIVGGKATLLGVVSYGSKCADDYPGVYTQISYYLDWIRDNMAENAK